MTPSEIVKKDSETNGYGFDAQELGEYIMSSINQGWKLTHDADTLFMFKPQNNRGDVEFIMMVGEEQTAPKSCQKFFDMMKKIGAKQLKTEYLNTDFTEIFQKLGSKYKTSFGKADDELTMKVRL